MHTRIRELLDYLDAQRTVLRAAYDAVPANMRSDAPAPGRWSAANVVEHLAIVEARVAGSIKVRVDGARAEGVGPDLSVEPILPTLAVNRVLTRETRVNAPEAVRPTGLPAEEAWAALERATVGVRDALVASDGIDLGAISMPHPLFGPLSLYAWFAFLAAHEARHAAQIREELPARAAIE